MTDTPPLPYGKTCRAPFHPTAGVILGPSLKPSQTARFLCLTAENGRPPVWSPALAPVSLGGSWIPNISEAPNQGEGCSLWRIIEDNAPEKYYLTPYLCTKYLRMAKKAGCRFPEPVEAVLLKQGGRMQK